MKPSDKHCWEMLHHVAMTRDQKRTERVEETPASIQLVIGMRSYNATMEETASLQEQGWGYRTWAVTEFNLTQAIYIQSVFNPRNVVHINFP